MIASLLQKLLAMSALFWAMAAHADDVAPAKLAADASEAQLQLIEQSLFAGRLVQTEAMLGWLQPRLVGGYLNRFNLALAEYHLAREDVSAAEAAIAQVDGSLTDSCRYSGISGWVSFQRRDWNRAIQMLAGALDNCPGDAGRWNLLGQALAQKGEYAASVEAYDVALGLNTAKAAILNNRALSFAYSGQFRQSLDDLMQAAAIDPDNLTISENMAFVRALAGLDFTPLDERGQSAARSLASAGEGALAGREPERATSYFARAVLASERFDPELWRRANGETGGKAR